MRLLTASYGTWRREFGAPVVASLSLPKWLPESRAWPKCWALTPRWRYFDAEEHVFELAYLEQLDSYGVNGITTRLEQIAAETDATTLVICCFEADVFECHRGTFRSWWHENTGEWISDLSELTTRKEAP